jgi:deazaflavin-dependent oxidoreductase (nitroreductase family)
MDVSNPMNTCVSKRRVRDERRPLLGLRRRPGRLALQLFRMPLRAYRHDAGWMLGHTFLRFTHNGRQTGRPYETVAMVLTFDETSREAVICAAWGPETDWLRNVQAGPAISVDIGRDHFVPAHRFLTVDEGTRVADTFRHEHPHRLRLMQRILGWGDLSDDAALRDFAARHPMVAFRPGG